MSRTTPSFSIIAAMASASSMPVFSRSFGEYCASADFRFCAMLS